MNPPGWDGPKCIECRLLELRVHADGRVIFWCRRRRKAVRRSDTQRGCRHVIPQTAFN
jgi:hypothetical protein